MTTRFLVRVYDITNIKKPRFINHFTIHAKSKDEATDSSHTKAEQKFGNSFPMLVQIKEESNDYQIQPLYR